MAWERKADFVRWNMATRYGFMDLTLSKHEIKITAIRASAEQLRSLA